MSWFNVFARLNRLETIVATLAEEITRLQADSDQIKADVTAVQAAIAAEEAAIQQLKDTIALGNLTPEQVAALEQIAADLEAAHVAFAAALPATGTGETPAP